MFFVVELLGSITKNSGDIMDAIGILALASIVVFFFLLIVGGPQLVVVIAVCVFAIIAVLFGIGLIVFGLHKAGTGSLKLVKLVTKRN